MILCGCHGLQDCPALRGQRELSPHAPKQIAEIVNIDQMDSADRAKLDPAIKLQLLMAESKSSTGRDPRGGGYAIVGRPRVVLQLLLDLLVGPLSGGDVRLDKAIKFGTRDSDVVAKYLDVPIMVRSSVIDDRLYCLPVEQIPPSKGVDRQRAGELRINAHGGTLLSLREGN